MRYILYIKSKIRCVILSTIVLLIMISLSACTIVFKAKEIELDTEPVLSYELDHIDLLKESEVFTCSNSYQSWR